MLLLLQKKKLQKQKTHNLNSDICKRRHFMSPFFILQILVVELQIQKKDFLKKEVFKKGE